MGYLIGEDVAGGKMKETGTVEGGNGHWKSPNRGATNESGFSGLPGGYRYGSYGSFRSLGYLGNFWSSSQNDTSYAWNRGLYYDSAYVYRYSISKAYGFSVRCLKDTLAP